MVRGSRDDIFLGLFMYIKVKIMFNEETIAAVSTPPGTGGIGIVRVSGERAFDIADSIFRGKKDFGEIGSHTVNYGKIIDPVSKEVIDEVLLTKMKKPHTFTREDVVEINCHGSTAVLKRLLDIIIKSGARLAEPGEFTKRAFLNGRMDLSQAEAVIDLINSKTDESSKAAVNQLEGKLSKKLKDARQKLIELIAHIEVTVDYPEHDIEEVTGEKVYSELKIIDQKLKDITKGFEKGRILREGINVVIVGRPNVGKSSLLNELAGKNKAIVTEIPGTTRDIIEEFVSIKGIPVKLVDTAGIRETEDVVEKIGVERAKKAIDNADLLIMMIDADSGFEEEDLSIIEKIRDRNKKMLFLINKIDLVDEKALQNLRLKLLGFKVLETSLKNDLGVGKLEEEIAGMFLKGEVNLNSEVLLTNVRHKNLLDKAIQSIEDAMLSYESAMPLDCITIDIKNAAEHLGEITGESVSEDVMHEIFSRFCIGK